MRGFQGDVLTHNTWVIQKYRALPQDLRKEQPSALQWTHVHVVALS